MDHFHQQTSGKMTAKKLVPSKIIFMVTMGITIVTILSIWLFGLGRHQTLFENSILSVSILSIIFFLFFTIGLYKGIKLKDNLGKVTDKIKPLDLSSLASVDIGFIGIGDGIEGILAGILLWIVGTILVAIVFSLLFTVIWAGMIIFVAVLYWAFFRAFRLVFKNSNRCKGNLIASIAYGAGYTMLYNFWIYGIILGFQYLMK